MFEISTGRLFGTDIFCLPYRNIPLLFFLDINLLCECIWTCVSVRIADFGCPGGNRRTSASSFA